MGSSFYTKPKSGLLYELLIGSIGLLYELGSSFINFSGEAAGAKKSDTLGSFITTSLLLRADEKGKVFDFMIFAESSYLKAAVSDRDTPNYFFCSWTVSTQIAS